MLFKNSSAKPVILCIGTTKVAGDSLGPRVGDKLISDYNIEAYVYGKSDSPVTGVNFDRYMRHIKVHHAKSLVIAVDACLGEKKDIGKVKYSMKGLTAGAALNKNLGVVGDLGMLGIVGERGNNNLDALLNADVNVVEEIASRVAQKIFNLVEAR